MTNTSPSGKLRGTRIVDISATEYFAVRLLNGPVTQTDGIASDGGEREGLQPTRWLLMDAPRPLIAGIILLGVSISIFLLGKADLIAVLDPNPVLFLFSSLIAGNLTLVSIVPSVNQLALSRELASEQEFQNRITSVQEFRRTAEDRMAVMTSPPDPADFLRVVLESVRQQAKTLERNETPSDESAHTDIDAFATTVANQAAMAAAELEDAEFGSFDVLSTALAYDSSWQIYTVNRIQNENADYLSPSDREALADLKDTLELFGVARAYFKTLYLQRELAKITRVIPYVGLVALLTSGFTVLVYGSRTGTTLPSADLLGLVSVTGTLGLAPLAVILAFVPRVTAVIRRTVSMGAFSGASVGETDS